MTHEHEGKYSAKHPAGTTYEPDIAAAIKEKADNGRISCTAAHGLAADFGVTPSEIGKTVDLLEYRIIKCQLGLFGYSPEKKITTALEDMPDALRDQLQESGSAGNGRISCSVCWEIAKMLNIGKMTVSSACESLGLKIGPCQLGAF